MLQTVWADREHNKNSQKQGWMVKYIPFLKAIFKY